MNKHRRYMWLVALAVMLVCMTAFASAALASGEPTPKPATTVKPTATPFATFVPTPTATLAPATRTLTPGGNLTMVDDLSGVASEDKQFITVVTKNGNYFYIIIDRASNSDNVYFLNKVDEADLMAVLEEAGYEIEATPTPSPTPKPTANPDALKDDAADKPGSPLLIAILAAIAIGAFVFFKKKKAATTNTPRPEDYPYDDEDEDEEDDEDADTPKPMNHAVQKKGWNGIL